MLVVIVLPPDISSFFIKVVLFLPSLPLKLSAVGIWTSKLKRCVKSGE
jgi:hypothetical protein